MFFRGSRYEDVPTLDHESGDARVTRYKALRTIPATPGLWRHVVDEGERLDHIAYEHFRDAERFWRLADANLAIHPHELTDRPGRVLDVPSSEA